MDSIYAKRSASALRVKTQGTEHRLMYALGGTLLSAAFCLLCYAASEWRTTKGVASGGTNLVDGITSSIRRPKMNLVPSVRRLKPGTFSSLHCLQSDNTPCGSDELMSNARWSDDGTTLKQSVGTSASNSIVKPVSTLP